jgi:hypothetical protein
MKDSAIFLIARAVVLDGPQLVIHAKTSRKQGLERRGI